MSRGFFVFKIGKINKRGQSGLFLSLASTPNQNTLFTVFSSISHL